MENRGKKFIIPELEEIDEITEKNTAPSYFQAGKLTDRENDSKNDDSSKINPTSASPGPNQNAQASESDFFKMSDPNPTTTVTNHNCNVPHTKFESAFSNLRSSKFYESCEHADDPSVTNKKKTEFFSKGTGSILVNPRQRGNPLLLSIRNVPWEFEEIEPDYIIGKTACVLFLSMRYHNLFPNYIHERLKSLGKSYNLRVLLVQVDVLEPSHPLKDLSVIAILADCTLMVAWSPEEAGSYLETYKMFENKSADLIKEKQGDDHYSQLIDCLTTVRSINKTDAMVLLSTFGTLEKIMKASVSHLSMCPGMGPLKAKRLYDAFRKPFKNEKKDGKQKA